MRRLISLAACLSLAAGVAACGPAYDPQTREGVWQASHVNRANLTLTAASPADLVHGRGTPATDGMTQTAAIERLRNDKVKKLPDSGLSTINVNGSGSNNTSTGQ